MVTRTALARHRELLLVLAATALTFGVSVRFPFLAWDDPRYAAGNPLVLHPLARGLRTLLTTPALGYPQSVTVLSYALHARAFGLTPWSFHAVNVALHLLNVALVYRLASCLGLTGRQAACAALIVGVHPLVVEPVCWVTGRKDLLAATFVLAALAVILAEARDAPFPGLPRWTVASLLLLLGVGAKPSVAVAPLFVFVVVRVARPAWSPRRVALALAPIALTALALLVLLGRSVKDVHARSLRDTALDVLGAWTLQGGHLLFPVDLVTSYARLEDDPSPLAMVVGALVLAALVAAATRMDRRSPGFAGLALAVIAYAPVSGIVAVNRWTADSYMYLPLVGIAVAAVAWAGPRVPERLRPWAPAGVAALGLALMIDAFAHASNWRTPEGPWLATVARYPTNPVAYNELARTWSWDGDKEASVREYLELDARFPDFEFARDERAQALVTARRPERATALLAAAIADADRSSARAYWLMLLDGRLAATPATAGMAHTSFLMMQSEMRAQIRERAIWMRVAALLRASGLPDDGAAAEDVARSLPP